MPNSRDNPFLNKATINTPSLHSMHNSEWLNQHTGHKSSHHVSPHMSALGPGPTVAPAASSPNSTQISIKAHFNDHSSSNVHSTRSRNSHCHEGNTFIRTFNVIYSPEGNNTKQQAISPNEPGTKEEINFTTCSNELTLSSPILVPALIILLLLSQANLTFLFW